MLLSVDLLVFFSDVELLVLVTWMLSMFARDGDVYGENKPALPATTFAIDRDSPKTRTPSRNEPVAQAIKELKRISYLFLCFENLLC